MAGSLPTIPGSLISKDSEVNYSEVLQDDFNDKITEILETPQDKTFFNSKITIACYKYYTAVLEYLVHGN